MIADRQFERANAIEKAILIVQKEQAKRCIAFGLKIGPTSPKGFEHSEDLRFLPAWSDVFVYRNASKKWEGPFKFIEITDEPVKVQLPRGRKIFRSSAVSHYLNL